MTCNLICWGPGSAASPVVRFVLGRWCRSARCALPEGSHPLWFFDVWSVGKLLMLSMLAATVPSDLRQEEIHPLGNKMGISESGQ